jgi:prepilin-type processing-associated H-X9-DG protein
MNDVNADNWIQDTTSSQKSWIDWRSPFVPPTGAANANWTSLPTRTIDRHSKRCVMGFVDGHDEIDKASSIGFYQPMSSAADWWSGI